MESFRLPVRPDGISCNIIKPPASRVIIQADSKDVLKHIEDDSVVAVFVDSPDLLQLKYELRRQWDSRVNAADDKRDIFSPSCEYDSFTEGPDKNEN